MCCFCRQCLCCFKEYKHLEVFNQLIYALINLVIAQISSLRNRLCSSQNQIQKGAESEWSRDELAPGSLPQPTSPGEDEPVNVERDSAEEDADISNMNQNKTPSQDQGSNCTEEARGEALRPAGGSSESREGEDYAAASCDNDDSQDPFGSWSTEEREKLLLCAAKIFQIQFPLYTAYKHNTHPTLEVRPYTDS